jgi:hypothetical protein
MTTYVQIFVHNFPSDGINIFPFVAVKIESWDVK